MIIKHAPSEVRKKRRKEVWQHFDSFPQDNTKARCKLCSQTIEMKAHSVTIDLVKHLNTHEIKLELETCSICIRFQAASIIRNAQREGTWTLKKNC